EQHVPVAKIAQERAVARTAEVEEPRRVRAERRVELLLELADPAPVRRREIRLQERFPRVAVEERRIGVREELVHRLPEARDGVLPRADRSGLQTDRAIEPEEQDLRRLVVRLDDAVVL